MLQNDLQEHHPTTYVTTVKSLSVKKIVFFRKRGEHIEELRKYLSKEIKDMVSCLLKINNGSDVNII
jgi:hypothetical protein